MYWVVHTKAESGHVKRYFLFNMPMKVTGISQLLSGGETQERRIGLDRILFNLWVFEGYKLLIIYTKLGSVSSEKISTTNRVPAD